MDLMNYEDALKKLNLQKLDTRRDILCSESSSYLNMTLRYLGPGTMGDCDLGSLGPLDLGTLEP